MIVESGHSYHNGTLGTTPAYVNFTSGRPPGMVGLKAKLSSAAGGNLLIMGIPNSGSAGSTVSSPPTMTSGVVWDECYPAQTINGLADAGYGDPNMDYWVAMSAGTGEVTVWPLTNQGS